MNCIVQKISYWKYVDDTTASENVPKNQSSHFQSSANELVTWTDRNKFQLHNKKCKELLIQFQKERAPFPGVQLNSECPELVRHAKIPGLTITDDLKWTKHVTEIIKKANQRIYSVVQLKRAKVPPKEIITFYCSCVRPVLEYSSEVYHFAPPVYLSDAIERVQRRVTSIIFPGISYGERLQRANLTTLHECRRQACGKVFREISNNPTHKLFNLLPMTDEVAYDLRNKRNFQLPTVRTNRFLRSFIPASIREFS